ncbi:MAG TPA: ROK family protein [Gaiellales bacterium]
MTIAIGIDVGGTKIAAGLVDTATGELQERFEVPTGAARPAAAVLADCVALADELAEGHGGLPIGMGVCELVDRHGRTRSAVTLDWRDVDLPAAFGPLGRATIESDVRAAAVAEARFGAGRGVAELLYVTVSTGISHCLVLDGRAYAGARGNAICTGAPPLEERASGLALARAGRRERAQDVLADPALDCVVVAAATALGTVLAELVNALDPGVLVIGGGLGLAQRYRELAVAALRPLIFADDTRDLPVVPAMLGADAGIIGAALAAVRA